MQQYSELNASLNAILVWARWTLDRAVRKSKNDAEPQLQKFPLLIAAFWSRGRPTVRCAFLRVPPPRAAIINFQHLIFLRILLEL